jgi:Amt family ammonium transporter
MHLRVSEEAEMIGLDVDQFFDEQIGDWSVFDENKAMTITEGKSQPVSSAGSAHNVDGIKETTKTV